MQNHRTPSELKAALDAIVAELQLRLSELTLIPDAELVPLAKVTAACCGIAETIGQRIATRVLVDGVNVPGACCKPGTTHRKWHDPAIAADLAFKAIGLAAFKLDSPAALEKLGDEGKALVAVASYKPFATDRVVY